MPRCSVDTHMSRCVMGLQTIEARRTLDLLAGEKENPERMFRTRALRFCKALAGAKEFGTEKESTGIFKSSSRWYDSHRRHSGWSIANRATGRYPQSIFLAE